MDATLLQQVATDLLARAARKEHVVQKRALKEDLVEGMELSPKVGRMCAMNLSPHGIGGDKVVIHPGHDTWPRRPCPAAGSQIWSHGLDHRGGVKYCPAPRANSAAERCSSSS